MSLSLISHIWANLGTSGNMHKYPSLCRWSKVVHERRLSSNVFYPSDSDDMSIVNVGVSETVLISYSSSKDRSISFPVVAYFPAFKLPPPSPKLFWALSCLARGLAFVFETSILQGFSHGSIHLKDWKKNIYNSLWFLIFLKMFSMESSGTCQSISFRSGLKEQTTLFLQRAEWLQWVFIVNDKMLWFRKIIFQQSHRNMCFLNHFLWNGVQGLFCPSTQILSHKVLFFSLFIGIYMLYVSLTGNHSPTARLGFYQSGSPYKYIYI